MQLKHPGKAKSSDIYRVAQIGGIEGSLSATVPMVIARTQADIGLSMTTEGIILAAADDCAFNGDVWVVGVTWAWVYILFASLLYPARLPRSGSGLRGRLLLRLLLSLHLGFNAPDLLRGDQISLTSNACFANRQVLALNFLNTLTSAIQMNDIHFTALRLQCLHPVSQKVKLYSQMTAAKVIFALMDFNISQRDSI
ncbi:hypothetical protein V1524DRAFT_475822 [Lipomyces starkeyi]